jgi:Ca-activated chloride channel family protein
MKTRCALLSALFACLVAVVPARAQSRLELVFAYGSEKEQWIKECTDQFNRSRPRTASGVPFTVRQLPMGSGECLEGVLAGKLQAHVVSPASGVFIKLANAERRAKTGQDLVNATENLVLSPVVIAMWQPMAEALGWGKKPVGWAEILALARDEQGWASLGMGQWGQFKFGHTHPEYSNSGLISVIAEAYAGAGKIAGLTTEDLARPEVADYVRSIEQAVVHYGSSTGFFGKKLFANGPGYLSAAVLYENMVIESYSGAYALPFPVVAIYPKEGTFWSDHPAGVVEADWVTPAHREAAQSYLKFLLARPQQERAMAAGFRPGLVDVALAAPVDRAHGVDPQEPRTTLEVPRPEVVKSITELWRKVKKHSNVVLVLDTSGSMRDENRIGNARRGGLQMLRLLGDEDHFALLPFNNQVNWAVRSTPLRTGRAEAEKRIGGLWAEGGTALYDAIREAHRELLAHPLPGTISAVVVLTDGQDTNSRSKLPQLLEQIRFDSERNTVRVFTIGYGQGANKEVLQAIADATQARSYEGTNDNIEQVFKDISTFF